jgi:hypothetical protein
LSLTQHHDGKSVGQHGCVVVLYNGISEYHAAVAMAAAGKALNVYGVEIPYSDSGPSNIWLCYLGTHSMVSCIFLRGD